MSFNPLNEIKYKFRLAVEQLERANGSFSLGDWVGTVSSSQLAVENFAKTIVAVFEVPTWSHDPSNQLKSLINKLPGSLAEEVEELSAMAREMAPEHGRSSYGEPDAGLTPSDIYKEDHASSALNNAKRAKTITEKVLRELKIRI